MLASQHQEGVYLFELVQVVASDGLKLTTHGRTSREQQRRREGEMECRR